MKYVKPSLGLVGYALCNGREGNYETDLQSNGYFIEYCFSWLY